MATIINDCQPTKKYDQSLFVDSNFRGELSLPGIETAQQVSIAGTYYFVEVQTIVSKISMPDLERVNGGFYVEYATNVSSLEVPKLAIVGGVLAIV